MSGTNPEYTTCRIAILDRFIDRMDIEIAAYKHLRDAVIDHESKSRRPRQEDKRT